MMPTQGEIREHFTYRRDDTTAVFAVTAYGGRLGKNLGLPAYVRGSSGMQAMERGKSLLKFFKVPRADWYNVRLVTPAEMEAKPCR